MLNVDTDTFVAYSVGTGKEELAPVGRPVVP